MSEKQAYRDSDDMPTERAVLEREWKAMRLALSMPRAAVQAAQPEAVGWKRVPVEPTPAMLVAMWDHRESMRGQSENRIARAGYDAMLASAPPPEPMSAPTAEPVAKVSENRPVLYSDEYATPPSTATPEPSDAERCPSCDDTGDLHDQTGEWRGTCKCPAGKTEATNIEAAAKVIAERMDYPWEHMYEKGRNNMRDIAREAIDAAIRATKGGKL